MTRQRGRWQAAVVVSILGLLAGGGASFALALDEGEVCWGDQYCCPEDEQVCCWDHARCDIISWVECEYDWNRGCEGVIGNTMCYTHLECPAH
jgi:hypothetical protein